MWATQHVFHSPLASAVALCGARECAGASITACATIIAVYVVRSVPFFLMFVLNQTLFDVISVPAGGVWLDSCMAVCEMLRGICTAPAAPRACMCFVQPGFFLQQQPDCCSWSCSWSSGWTFVRSSACLTNGCDVLSCSHANSTKALPLTQTSAVHAPPDCSNTSAQTRPQALSGKPTSGRPALCCVHAQ